MQKILFLWVSIKNTTDDPDMRKISFECFSLGQSFPGSITDKHLSLCRKADNKQFGSNTDAPGFDRYMHQKSLTLCLLLYIHEQVLLWFLLSADRACRPVGEMQHLNTEQLNGSTWFDLTQLNIPEDPIPSWCLPLTFAIKDNVDSYFKNKIPDVSPKWFIL